MCGEGGLCESVCVGGGGCVRAGGSGRGDKGWWIVESMCVWEGDK